MKRNLDIGTKITLKRDGVLTEFTVLDVLGVGGGCVAYDVSYKENEDISHRGVLKEFCPAFLENDGNFARENKSIIVPPKYEDLFKNELQRFRQTYKSINTYLSENISASNFHTVQIGLYEGNNTLYTLNSKDSGKSYEKIENENLLNILKLALSVTKAVEQYHEWGYVHLDIKPKNILILDEVTDLIKLFDYDSLISISDLRQRKISVVPIPEDYYVPELAKGEIRKVGVQTDIFEIGAMIFLRIFNRGCNPDDLSHDKKYNFDEIPMFAGVPPQAKYELEILFKNTLQISQHLRYKTIEELKNQLKKITELVASKKPYLINLPKWQPSRFSIGRHQELIDIKAMLDENGYVFVKAMGGTGKSELAKLFAHKYASDYHTVQFCKYGDSLKTLVASLPFDEFDDNAYQNFDDLLKEKNKLLHLCEGNTLIIVDNFNVTHDEYIRDFLPSDNKSFKVIFTTRCTQAADYYESKTYNLGHLTVDECKALFIKHSFSEFSEEDTEILEKILQMIDYNTLVIVLLAATVRKTKMKMREVFDILSEEQIDKIDDKIFHEYDFDSYDAETYNKMNSHLKTIFNISGLSDSEKEVLKIMTLIASCGIEKSDILNRHLISEAVTDKLIDFGWIETINTRITMHSVVSDLISNDKTVKKSKNYYDAADFIEEKCNPDPEAHIKIVTDNISYARHLERRFKDEPIRKRTDIKIKIGRLYHILYRPKEAKKYLLQALEMSAKDLRSISQIYHFLGKVEKDFGTETMALEYFRKSVVNGKNIKARCYDTVLDSAIESAEIHIENHNLDKAFEEYKNSLGFAKKHFCKSYIHKISEKLVQLCIDLGLDSKTEKYKKQEKKYAKYAKKENVIPEFENTDDFIARADSEGMKNAYETYLSRMREQLGEDSPTYMALTRDAWAFSLIEGNREEGMRGISKILSFIESTHGKESMEMAKMLDFVASSVTFLKDVDYATKCALRSIEICKKNHEENSYVFTSARLHLAFCYYYAGKSKKLLDILDEIDFSKFRGKEVLEDAVFNLGLPLCDLNKFDEAEILANAVLEKNSISSGVKVIACQMLTNINTAMGNFDLAEKHLKHMKKLIDIMEEHGHRNQFVFSYHRYKAKIAFGRLNYSEALENIDISLTYIDKLNLTPAIVSACHSEKGLYLHSLGKNGEAEKEFDIAKEILDCANTEPELYTVLYNNYACMYLEEGKYEKASEYFEKAIQYSVGNSIPTTFFEALLFSNMGCVLYMMNKKEEAVSHLQTAQKGFEDVKCEKTSEYFLTRYILSSIYSELDICAEAIDDYRFLYENIDKYIFDGNENDYKKTTAINYIKSLLELGRNREAYNTAVETAEFLKKKLGSDSLFYIDTISDIGSWFQNYSRKECLEFFEEAQKCIAEGNYEGTISNASLLNYIGVYLTDTAEDHNLAMKYFETSKKLYEVLDETDNESFEVVLENIKTVQGKISE